MKLKLFIHLTRNVIWYTHCGKKQFLVQKIFSKVSSKYDLMNDVMSLGLHRTWKSYFVDLIEINSKSNILDLASGSGDIIKLLKKKTYTILGILLWAVML